jgi:hypothetical protein
VRLRTVDDLPAKLEDVRGRIAHYTELLQQREAAAAAARGLLAQDSTYPRRRREIESELLAAEMDLGWIRPDLTALVSRERVLEADLAELMVRDLELAATEKARAAKAAKAKRKATARVKPTHGKNDGADASEKGSATTRA